MVVPYSEKLLLLCNAVSAAYIGIMSSGKPMAKSADISLGLMSSTQRGQNTKA